MMNTIVQTTGFFMVTFSVFLPALRRSISLHLLILNVLNIITNTYIIAKYIKVLTHAFIENMNLNLVISASNILATITLINCERIVPITSPATSETMPISSVSKKRITEIFLLLIPSVRYMPNSLLRLLIRKRLAYIIRNPSMHDTNTLTPESMSFISLIISITFALTSSITLWLSIALNT